MKIIVQQLTFTKNISFKLYFKTNYNKTNKKLNLYNI